MIQIPNAFVIKATPIAAKISMLIEPHEHTYYVMIKTSRFNIHIEKLPSYSDRGTYKVIIEAIDRKKDVVDSADMFPRLYFIKECLILEISKWLEKRNDTDIDQFSIEFNP